MNYAHCAVLYLCGKMVLGLLRCGLHWKLTMVLRDCNTRPRRELCPLVHSVLLLSDSCLLTSAAAQCLKLPTPTDQQA
jgi:hypothetical protein